MNLYADIVDTQSFENVKEHENVKGFSFYQKLFFLYFLNIVDWFCTEVLIGSGSFYEANPIMQPVLSNFWLTLLIKGLLPFALVILCAVIFRLCHEEQTKVSNFLLGIGITAYALVNLWHIMNFVLLFLSD